MTTLFLICGLPGAGKTTLAKQIERDHAALRLTPDEWMARIVGDGFDDKRRAAVEAAMWEIAARVLGLGVSVVLDFGFWPRADRDDYRARAAAIGVECRLCVLDPPLEVLRERLAARRADTPGDTFVVSDEQLALYATWWEPPSPDELGQDRSDLRQADD